MLAGPLSSQEVRTLRYSAEQDFTYQYVPFQVAPGTQQINVSYTYSDTGVEGPQRNSAIDIGLIAPSRFCGWSGGQRSELFVSSTAATPGYLAGIEPGEWQVILGLYKVAPEGVTVELTLETDVESDGPAGAPERDYYRPIDFTEVVQPKGLRWYSGDLHVHTVHSDGTRTIPELVKEFESSDLDFISLTEHNTVSHHFAVPPTRKTILLGEEVTTHAGHLNLIGLAPGQWYDFRKSIEDLYDQSRKDDAILMANHPFIPYKGCPWAHGYEADMDLLEVWNGPWDLSDEAALLFWDRLLATGRRVTGVAASDTHRPEQPLGHPCTRVLAESANRADLIKGLRSGEAVMTATPEALPLRFTRSGATFEVRLEEALMNHSVELVHSTGRERQSTVYNGSVYRFELENFGSDDYARVEVRNSDNVVVMLSNPIFGTESLR